MKLLESQVFRGPNIYSIKPVIRFVLDIEDLEEKPSNLIPDFSEGLIKILPSLHQHRCSEGVPGGFVSRLQEGTWAGHIIEHIAIELQCLVGTQVGFGRCRSTGKKGQYNVIFSYLVEKVGKQAGLTAIKIVEHLAYGKPLNLKEDMALLWRILDETKYGPSTQGIIDKATERDIPILRLSNQNLVQLGHGKYQKRIEATVTSMTGLIATDIAGNKQLTKSLLGDIGIPVPKGDIARTVDEAVEIAESIGYPVVIKPLNANHGKGVAVQLFTAKEVVEAFDRAVDFSDEIVVEQFIEGHDHRVLVIGGEVVAAAERLPAHVIGDGKQTVEALLEIENQNPLRGEGHEKPLSKIVVNLETERCLAKQGLNLQAIPRRGEKVWLKFTANISTGGTALDRTDEIHPSNLEAARRAAKVIGLDIAGVDMITKDISQPLEENKGAICEVNAAPGFRMHLHPSSGKPRDVAGALLDMLFPPNSPSRVPIVAITGTNGKTTTSRMLAHILKLSGHKVGLTTTDGLYIDGKRLLQGDLTGPWSAQIVLRDPNVDFAVLETARGGILRSGLGFDTCQIGIITNVSADHLGLRGIETVEELAYVKSLVVEVVQDNGYSILNAEDPNVKLITERAHGKICYFSINPNHELFQKHIKKQGIGITLKKTLMIVKHGNKIIPIIDVKEIPATFNGLAVFNTANAMAAALAAYLTNVNLEDIRTGLKTFNTNFYLSPGRLNLIQVRDFQVLIDYAHNIEAYRNITQFIHKLSADRRIGIVAAPGDRRDVDLMEIGKIAGEAFDKLIIKEDEDTRGRQPGEIANLLEKAALAAGRQPEDIQIILNEFEAVSKTLKEAKKDDLIVITAAKIQQTFDQVESFRNGAAKNLGIIKEIKLVSKEG
jgi:cyanophycin synthetase